jgi:hypothetical protein
MRRMINLLGVALLAGCGVAEEQVNESEAAASAATVFHSVWSGGGASVWGGDETSSYGVDVWENTNKTGGGEAALSYYRSTVDPTSLTCWTETYPCHPDDVECVPGEYTYCTYTRYTYENGWGVIPFEAFAADRNGAVLDVDLSTLSQFYGERCTVDEAAWSWSCTPTTTGEIHLAWVANKKGSTRWSGVRMSRWGKYSFRSNGVWSSVTSEVNGTMLGNTVTASGNVGTGINVSRDLQLATSPNL